MKPAHLSRLFFVLSHPEKPEFECSGDEKLSLISNFRKLISSDVPY
jgi:hypothetical protein